jgi:large subunit ribosomal protein L35
MPKIKTHQSIAKRFKISKSGKLMKKKNGQNHFNAREKGSVTRAKRRPVNVSNTISKQLKDLITYSR